MNPFLKTELEIINWLNKMQIRNYSIIPNENPQWSHCSFVVNVIGNVILKQEKLTHLPIQFCSIKGSFDISGNELTTLKGSPWEVYGPFYAHDNPLSNLDDAPQDVAEFSCSGEIILEAIVKLDCEIAFNFIHGEKNIEKLIPELKNLYTYDKTYQGWVFVDKISNRDNDRKLGNQKFKTFIASLMEKSRLEKQIINKESDTKQQKI